MLYTKELISRGTYDILVCGGGYTGFAAAYAAAREGKRVLLIERGSCLGGTGTAGLVTDILGQRRIDEGKLADSVRGIYTLLEERLLAEGAALDAHKIDYTLHPHGWLPFLGTGLLYDNERMKALLETMLKEIGTEILYYTDIVDVIRTDDKVEGVILHNKNGLQAVYGTCVIDTTGDGDVCADAGCAYEFGDEEGGLAAASLEMQVENVNDAELMEYMKQTGDVRFRKIIGELIERGIWKFPYTIFISVLLTKPGVYMINTIRQVGINGINAESLTAGTIDGRAENLALLDIMRAHFPGFANAEVRQIAQSIGIRETRRIVGDYTLTVQDLIDGTCFPDSIAVSAYHWDLPDPKSPSHQPYEGVTRKSPYTPIPYRCLLPKGVTGLLAAGRCISVEREVLGPVRVMGPCLAMGEAAGIAAAMALENGGDFRNVDTALLKQRVEEYGGITEMP